MSSITSKTEGNHGKTQGVKRPLKDYMKSKKKNERNKKISIIILAWLIALSFLYIAYVKLMILWNK